MGKPVIVAMSVGSWIKANVEMVRNYLKSKPEVLVNAHRANDSWAPSLTIVNMKKLFVLRIGWPIFPDSCFRAAAIARLLIANGAKNMHLHREDAYQWPFHQDTTRRGAMRKNRFVTPYVDWERALAPSSRVTPSSAGRGNLKIMA